MSRTFKDSLAYDLSAMFNTNEFAETVTITRRAYPGTDAAAIVVARMYETVDEDGMMTAVQSHDFDFTATDYKVLTNQVAPVPGDKIVDGNGQVFEALPLSGNQCFMILSDGLILRVHTKRIT